MVSNLNLNIDVCGLKGADRKCVYVEKNVVASYITRA
jgi:hypothetical protein